MHRSSRGRWLPLAIALALGVTGLVVVPATAAVNPPFNAWGTVRCAMSGTHTTKPGLTIAFEARGRRGVQGQPHVHHRHDRPERGHGPDGADHREGHARGAELLERGVARGPRHDQVEGRRGQGQPDADRVVGEQQLREPTHERRAIPPRRRSPARTRKAMRAPSSSAMACGQAACTTATGNAELQVQRDRRSLDVRDRGLAEHLGRDLPGRLQWHDAQPVEVAAELVRHQRRRGHQAGQQPGAELLRPRAGVGRWRVPASRRGGTSVSRATNGITYPYASGLVSTKDDFTFTVRLRRGAPLGRAGFRRDPELAGVLGERHRRPPDNR